MRIQDIVKKTGLQKRTIYYYIDQKLIEPAVDTHNGYHNFTDMDVEKLILIRKYRDAGFSLSDIKAILLNPRTATFYMHKQLNYLQTQLLVLQKTIKNLDEFSSRLPVCHSLQQLSVQLDGIEFKPDISKYETHFVSREARLVAQYLWESYIDNPMTEFQQFLWQKIMQHTRSHTQTSLKFMVQYLQYLPPEKLDAANVSQYLRNQRIIALTEEDYPVYTEELKRALLLFASDDIQKEQWKLLYSPLIRPTTLFAFSASKWLLEFHPDYQRYYENIHACCMLLKNYMDSNEGTQFKDILETAFGNNCDFKASGYGELEIAAFFHQSVYALLQPEEIQNFLNIASNTSLHQKQC